MEYKMKEVGFQTNLAYGELHVAGDEEYGFRPYQLMVSSIVVCSGGVLRKILEKKRIKIENMSIQTEVERNRQSADRIEKIHIHYVITGTNLDKVKIKKAMEIARRNCSMVQSVKDSIKITESLEIVASM